MRILIDMNLSPSWAGYLQANGYEGKQWIEFGRANAPDQTLFTFARDNGFVILTNDMDFGELLAKQNAKKPSVIVVRVSQTSPAAIGSRVLLELKEHHNELEAGAIIVIKLNKTRVISLPLGKHE